MAHSFAPPPDPDPPGRPDAMLPALLVLGLLCLLSYQLLTSTSPYRDTAFQIEISREPSFGEAVDRMVSDNQAPGAQMLFWAGARLGLDSITGQRALSIVLTTLAYAAALTFALRRRRGPGGLAPYTGAALVAMVGAIVLAPGVFPTSAMVRYSSPAGAVWLAAFVLTVRAVRGEHHLIPIIGVVLGLGTFLAYSILAAVVCTAAALLLVRATRSLRTVGSLTKGLAVGLIPTACWLLYAGAEHVTNIATREGGPRGSVLRSLPGHLYEMATWLLVGPGSLPTISGLALLAALAALTWFLLRRTGAGTAATVTFAAFTLGAIPVHLALNADSGWFMAGPAAVTMLAASHGAGRPATNGSVVPLALVALAAAVAALPAAGIGVLRPDTYANRAGDAVEQAGFMAQGGDVAYLVDERSALLEAGDTAGRDGGAVLTVRELLDGRSIPTGVVAILSDPGRSDERAALQEEVRRALEALGLERDGPSLLVGVYDHLALRNRLGITSGEAQYVVEEWRRGTSG